MAALSGIPRQEGCEWGEETATLSPSTPQALTVIPLPEPGEVRLSRSKGAEILVASLLRTGAGHREAENGWKVANEE